MITKEINYQVDGRTHKGFIAYRDDLAQPKPGILITHDWTGRNEFAQDKAIQLAELGYVGFAVDMYGDGQTGQTNDEKAALMMPMMEDRGLLRRRIAAAFHCLSSQSSVNSQKVLAMGYCFGGLCSLDLARSGADVKGVVSFHGLLSAPEKKTAARINAKILVLHGYDDPMVPPQSIDEFAQEMNQAGVDWQLHAYGNTLHSFTNPLANDRDFGTVYSPSADHRSWQATLNFFAEVIK